MKKEELEELNEMEDDQVENEESEEVEDNEESTEQENLPKKHVSQVSDDFKGIIKSYLDAYAIKDKVFGERYSNPNKNIEECCNYIVNIVKKTGKSGFSDEEVFKFARDYYVEEVDEKDLEPITCTVVSNHHTDEVGNKASKKAVAKKEKPKPSCEQLSLFDF